MQRTTLGAIATKLPIYACIDFMSSFVTTSNGVKFSAIEIYEDHTHPHTSVIIRGVAAITTIEECVHNVSLNSG